MGGGRHGARETCECVFVFARARETKSHRRDDHLDGHLWDGQYAVTASDAWRWGAAESKRSVCCHVVGLFLSRASHRPYSPVEEPREFAHLDRLVRGGRDRDREVCVAPKRAREWVGGGGLHVDVVVSRSLVSRHARKQGLVVIARELVVLKEDKDVV